MKKKEDQTWDRVWGYNKQDLKINCKMLGEGINNGWLRFLAAGWMPFTEIKAAGGVGLDEKSKNVLLSLMYWVGQKVLVWVWGMGWYKGIV